MSVDTRAGLALVHVDGACGSAESRSTDAVVRGLLGQAGAVVLARLGRTMVHQLAVLPSVSVCAGARVVCERDERACASVLARSIVAGARQCNLAHGSRVTHGAAAGEGRSTGDAHLHVAGASVLTARPRPRMARVHVLTVLAHVQRLAVAVGLSAGIGRDAGGSILARVR